MTEAEEKAFIADRVLERRDSKKALEAVREEMRSISKALRALSDGIGNGDFAADVHGTVLEFAQARQSHRLDFALITPQHIADLHARERAMVNRLAEIAQALKGFGID